MRQKAWTLFNYVGMIILLTLMLLIPQQAMVTSVLLILVIASHVILLDTDPVWNGTHNLAVIYTVLLSLFLIGILLWNTLSVRIFGGFLLGAACFLFLLEVVLAWQTMGDPFFRIQKSLERLKREKPEEEEWVVESIEPHREEYRAAEGGKTYHKATCPVLKRSKRQLKLSAAEIEALDLQPCRSCLR